MAKIIDFVCNSCGAPLTSEGHSNGKIVCPYCQAECLIDGLIKNAEILAKENINSGVSISLSREQLNSLVAESLTKPLAYPLDVLEKGVVIKEEHICVPAYLFYCNGMASYTYEIGVERQQQKITNVSRSGKVDSQSEYYVEWTPMSSSTGVSAEVIAPGNREYSEIIKVLYSQYDVNRLVDVEDLMFPTDVKTTAFNFPQPAAFGEVAKPAMEQLLKREAEKSLQGKNYRNMSMGGCQVQRDEVYRLTLGMYKLDFSYGDKNYTFFTTGDGAYHTWDAQPVDAGRAQAYNQMKKSEEQLSKSTYMTLAVISVVLAFLMSKWWFVGTALFGCLWYKRKKQLKEVTEQINAFVAQSNNVKQNFIQSGTFIQGIK